VTTVRVGKYVFNLPYRGRFGCQISVTLYRIMASQSHGMALYSAMGLRGSAKSYEGKYRYAFIRFAEANKDKLIPGNWGPKGGWGYKFVAPVEQPVQVEPNLFTVAEGGAR